MNNTVKWVLIALSLVLIVAVAAVLYKDLSEEYAGDLFNTDEGGNASAGEKNMAPDFTVIDKNGNEVKLSDLRGKPVVLNFWATWCYYCKTEMPDFDKAYDKYPDIQFMMVNATDGVQETKEKAESYVIGEGFDFDVFYDTKSEAVNAYYITSFPSTFFIDE